MLLKPTKLTKVQKRETVNKLLEESTPTYDFFLMLVLASIIVTIGLLLSNAAVIIGGMLVAPILFPILSLSMGIVVGDIKLIKRAGAVIIQSVVVATLISLFISLLFIRKEITPELISRIYPNLAYFLIAFVSGGAAAYALARPSLSAILPGVAVSVSLIPPLAAVGVSITFLSWEMTVGTAGLFFLNLIGIVFAGLIVFAVLKFYEVKEVIEKKIKAEEAVIKEEQKEKEKEKIEELEKRVREAEEILKEKKKES